MAWRVRLSNPLPKAVSRSTCHRSPNLSGSASNHPVVATGDDSDVEILGGPPKDGWSGNRSWTAPAECSGDGAFDGVTRSIVQTVLQRAAARFACHRSPNLSGSASPVPAIAAGDDNGVEIFGGLAKDGDMDPRNRQVLTPEIESLCQYSGLVRS